MDYLHLPFELKAIDEGKPGRIRGYVSTFGGPPDLVGDIVAPGAFKASIARSGGRVPVLNAHRSDQMIGFGVDAVEDAKGLLVTFELTLTTDGGRNAYELLKHAKELGHDAGLSIGFRIAEGGATFDSEGIRTLKVIDLLEYSFAPVPANPRARVTTVKSAAELEAAAAAAAIGSAKELRQFLRKYHDLPHRKAREIVHLVRTGEDDDPEPTEPASSKDLSPLELAKAFRQANRLEAARLAAIEEYSRKLTAQATAEAEKREPREKYTRQGSLADDDAEYREACKIDQLTYGKVQERTHSWFERQRAARRLNGKVEHYDKIAHDAALREAYKSIIQPLVAQLSAELTACKSADDREAKLYQLGWEDRDIRAFRAAGFCDF